MKEIQRGLDILTKEQREKAIKEIISFYLDERDEKMDIIGANDILDSFLQNIAPLVYNKAIDDTRMILQKQTENFDVELSVLKK